MTSGEKSLCFDTLIQFEFVQLSQEDAVSVRIRIPESEQTSKRYDTTCRKFCFLLVRT